MKAGDARVDVLISTFNEERSIDACLDAVLAQTAPIAVTVVDGGSSDGTVTRLRERAARDPRLTLVADGLRRTLPASLNLALAATARPFVAKVDARTFLVPDFIERALEVLDGAGPSVVAAGGSPEQFGDTRFGAGLARARTSRFGVGEAVTRTNGNARKSTPSNAGSIGAPRSRRSADSTPSCNSAKTKK